MGASVTLHATPHARLLALEAREAAEKQEVAGTEAGETEAGDCEADVIGDGALVRISGALGRRQLPREKFGFKASGFRILT